MARPAPSRVDAIPARGCGAGARGAALGPDLRSSRATADAAHRLRPLAAAGGKTSFRRGGRAGTADARDSDGRRLCSGQALGDGRPVHPGRLRGGAGALLCRQGGAVRRTLAERGSLTGKAQGAAELRPGAVRGRTLFSVFSDRMTIFAQRVAELTGTVESRLERLAGGDLSEVLLVPREEGPPLVAKGGPNVA